MGCIGLCCSCIEASASLDQWFYAWKLGTMLVSRMSQLIFKLRSATVLLAFIHAGGHLNSWLAWPFIKSPGLLTLSSILVHWSYLSISMNIQLREQFITRTYVCTCRPHMSHFIFNLSQRFLCFFIHTWWACCTRVKYQCRGSFRTDRMIPTNISNAARHYVWNQWAWCCFPAYSVVSFLYPFASTPLQTQCTSVL